MLNVVRGVGRVDAVGVAVAQIMEVGPVAAVALPSAVAKVGGKLCFPLVVRSVSCVAIVARTMCCFAVGRPVFDVAAVVRSTVCFAAVSLRVSGSLVIDVAVDGGRRKVADGACRWCLIFGIGAEDTQQHDAGAVF